MCEQPQLAPRHCYRDKKDYLISTAIAAPPFKVRACVVRQKS
jgi:hypothetical protein